MDLAAAVAQWAWAPVIAASISALYFRHARALPAWQRVLGSVHGVLLALLYAGALLIGASGLSAPSLAYPFWAALVLPLVSAALGFTWVRRPGAIHGSLLALLACAAWTFFIGTMAVTGQWL